jgi:2-polyprenyl-6-methoxyphenol hydroxylase-like FAD-dependent oxidoreductase
MSNQARNNIPVLVIGAGPTGLALAAELTRHGIACRIVDKATGPTPLPKATSVQARTMEVLEDMGVVDEVLAAGHQSHGVNIYSHTQRLMHFSYDDLESSYPFMLNIPQSGMERILGGRIARLGLAVEWQTELVGFTQDADGVTATLRDADGREETVRAGWLVGCDGAHSTVRHTLNIPFEGHTYQQWFGLADARIHWALRHDELHGFVHPQGLLFIIPMPGEDQYRLIVEAEKRADDAELTLADFQAAVDERGPGNARLSDPGWIAPFTVNARRAATHRQGRVFIAGDASHIHSPAGGQGMNTGIQDAYNLAWKLALVIRERANPALLDSYDAERTPVAEAVLRMTERLTTLLTMRNPVGQRVRNHLMPVLTGFGNVQHQMANQDAEFDISYRSSPAVAEHHHGRFGQARFVGGPRAGDRAPNAGPLGRADGSSVQLHDLLRGIHHTLLLFSGPEPAPSTLAHLTTLAQGMRDTHGEALQVYCIVNGATVPTELAGQSGVLLDAEGAVHHRYQADLSCLYLIRPDDYIGFRSRPADGAALETYLARIFRSSQRVGTVSAEGK